MVGDVEGADRVEVALDGARGGRGLLERGAYGFGDGHYFSFVGTCAGGRDGDQPTAPSI